ncbi:arylamine N-acetyltransferase family protein [Alloalcanivorax mobilis]|uniref:arylamine N-acetyltransferase family protein n=1 Tax=Alloalcanivorax mobilis TaxID=2019569 RepID=UPI0012FFDC97|nr:arylamine N-acetyltransferase [Alloalcanivorax mobilis]
MAEPFDLHAYLKRIAFHGEPRATLAVLAEIQRLHAQHLPFENLSPLLGEAVPLDLAALQQKLIRQRRGGYCYEHNLLLLEALRRVGFRARGLAARVFWNAPADARPPQTHMLLLVEWQGTDYLVDAGFGGMTPTGPLRLRERDVQRTPHEDFRVRPEGRLFALEARVAAAWKLIYKFDLEEQWLADYEVASWYLSHHPESMFVTNLIAARAAPEGRHSLLNDRYTLYRPDGHREERALAGATEALELLGTVFAIDVPDADALAARVEAILKAGKG